ncbi:MAG: hypothetical protein H8D26_07495 [Methanomicrobia archaeon]|nr:hypothetical protein [Methanomicrobia archaeon]
MGMGTGAGTGVEMGKIRIMDKNELVEKGKEIYKKIKDKLEPAHKGEIVAIEVKTGDYFLGKDLIEADEKAREKYPDEVFYFNKIGYRAVYVHR